MSDTFAGKQVRIARHGTLDDDTVQTPGLIRNVAFDGRNPDAEHLSAFLSVVRPGAVTAAHHHGDQETVLYVVSGRSRFRWGERLEHAAEAGPGDFVFVPSHLIHQEINASTEFETVWAVVRSGVNPVVVNLPELDAYIEHAAIEYTTPQ
ncbi:cupin domain-containing protein [Nonomuraea antimicrobica]|uniref:Cupin domain-containing protein n=1 Tax=Nonomuraea antimicrobica TaxID=561173 RepID=A0ABP7B5W9_9ACTN